MEEFFDGKNKDIFIAREDDDSYFSSLSQPSLKQHTLTV
jgi:hypothetical protein